VNRLVTDTLIVGGGAAGLSAALAAANVSGLRVTVVDDNPWLGGQIWRAELGANRSSEARRLIDAVSSKRIEILNQTQGFASPSDGLLLATTAQGAVELEYNKLIIATGARERFLPFPGWTLPNVVGAGGLQALVKGGLNIKDKRVVVAGTGPLLLAVADYLKAKGADVVLIAEQAPANKIGKFALQLLRSPSKLSQAIRLRRRLFGTRYLSECWVTAARGSEKLETVELRHKGKARILKCDFLACGFHLVPNIELAALLGCNITDGFVDVDECQQTSRENILCAGEPTGIGGVEKSLLEGKIAGLAASGQKAVASRYFRELNNLEKFTAALNRTFELRDELRHLADDTTIVCRCEDVEYARLLKFNNSREAKLQTRCGMGACQGRVCGAATEFLFCWKRGSVRPPIFPVKMEDL